MLRPLVTMPESKNVLSGIDIDTSLESIAESFFQYLSKYSSATNKNTKHGKMGTVGKVLSRMRSGKTGTSLVGEAVRIHEMAAHKTLGEGFQDLEQAILELSVIVERATLSERNRILSSIDAKVYYFIEKNNAMRLQEIKKQFVSFLELKYSDIASLQKEWQDSSIVSWDQVPFPYKKPRNDRMKPDIDAFYSSPKAKGFKEETGE